VKITNIETDKMCIKNVRLGKNVKLFNFINAYDCSIEEETKVGAFVEIQKNAFIGKRCKISSHTFICEGVHIGDNVFIGHNVSFINDKYPKAVNEQGKMITDKDWTVVNTLVDDGASIGTSSTILCGIKIGKNAIIGAGSVVTKDVPENAVVTGNPARIIRYINK
jgi:acetyltransferase-like isoleucine patch superfamily enzyme